MIHQPLRRGSCGQASDIEITAQERSKRLKNELYEIIAQHSGLRNHLIKSIKMEIEIIG